VTGGNTYHHAVCTVYRGTGFYAALAVIADLIVVAALISSYAVSVRPSATLTLPSSRIAEPPSQSQTLPVPEASVQSVPAAAPEPAAQTEENAPAIEEKESSTPTSGQTDADTDTNEDEPVVSPKKDTETENYTALKDFIDLSVNRGDSGRNYGAAGGSCEAEVLAATGRPDGCLKLAYDVSAAPAAVAGYSGDLDGIDLSLYRLLTFQVKKLEGRESFAVELSDGVNAAKVEIKQLLSEESYRGWQTITIPLEYFPGVDASRGMRGKLSIIFENSQGEPFAGTVFLRDIGFKR
jgi:hypothetical protein